MIFKYFCIETLEKAFWGLTKGVVDKMPSMEAEVVFEKLSRPSLAMIMDASVIDIDLLGEDSAGLEQAYSRITPTIETIAAKV